MKSLLAVLALVMGVSACSTVKKVVYRIDVPQGNYLEQDKIDQIKIGMTPVQVQYLLGTPMLKTYLAKIVGITSLLSVKVITIRFSVLYTFTLIIKA